MKQTTETYCKSIHNGEIKSSRLSDSKMRLNLNIIGSENGLSPGWRQAIIWTIRILLIGPLANFSEILIEIQTFLLKKKYVWKCRLRNVVHFVSASMC